MMSLGISIHTHNVLREQRIANSLPVIGAVALLPLVSTGRNYGTIGGSLTTTANPVFHPVYGMTFSGDDNGQLNVGTVPASFTVGWRGANVGNVPLVAVGQYAQPGGDAGVGIAKHEGNWRIIFPGIGYSPGTIAVDSLEHSFVIERDAGITTLYLDGVDVSNTNMVPKALGAYLLLNLTLLGSGTGTVRNLVYYSRALNTNERASITTWLAA